MEHDYHLMNRDIIVIVPCFNDSLRLKLCLDALYKQSIKKDRFTVVVIDNGSDEPPVELVKNHHNAVLLIEEQPGSYNARNKGITETQANYYAFTDADCLPESQWLETAINTIEERDLEAVGGPIKLFAMDQKNPTPFELLDMLSGFQQEVAVDTLAYTPTANLITKASTLEKVGLFNGALMSGGDKEWCQRLCRSGGVLGYDSEVAIHHPARASANEYYTKIRRLAHGMWARKNSDPTIREYLGIKGVISCITPPITRWRALFKGFKSVPASTKIIAACYLYTVKFYSQYHIQRCRLGLVKIAERK